jgi:Zn-dependent protease with chaperone function
MSFQAMQLVVSILLIVSGAFVGLIVLAFPALAAVAARQLAQRRRRNWRDRWARQRVLQHTFLGLAASNRATHSPDVEDYPEPEEAA